MNKADGLDFEGFKVLAQSKQAPPEERVGFGALAPRRSATMPMIRADLVAKVPALGRAGSSVLSIGIGCGELALHEISQAKSMGQRLVGVDSKEVLDVLPNGLERLAGRFPHGIPDAWLASNKGGFDAIVAYSVLQYVHSEDGMDGVFLFVKVAMQLLAPAGRIILGDLPNVDAWNRRLESPAGYCDHERLYPGRALPARRVQDGEIGDKEIMSIIAMARWTGFNAWVLEQANGLVFAGRREDVVIERP